MDKKTLAEIEKARKEFPKILPHQVFDVADRRRKSSEETKWHVQTSENSGRFLSTIEEVWEILTQK